MAESTAPSYENYKKKFDSCFSKTGDAIYGKGNSSLMLPPIELLILMLTNQIGDLNNSSTIMMGQEAKTNGDYTTALDGVITGIKSATPGFDAQLPQTSSSEPSIKSGDATINTTDDGHFHDQCAKFGNFLKSKGTAADTFNSELTTGGSYPDTTTPNFVHGKITVGDYKLPNIHVYKEFTINGTQHQNPYWSSGNMSPLQYGMYCNWFVQVYNGSIPHEQTSVSPQKLMTGQLGTYSDFYKAAGTFTSMNTSADSWNPEISNTGAPDILKVNSVLDGFSNVAVSTGVTYSQAPMPKPTDGSPTPQNTNPWTKQAPTTKNEDLTYAAFLPDQTAPNGKLSYAACAGQAIMADGGNGFTGATAAVGGDGKTVDPYAALMVTQTMNQGTSSTVASDINNSLQASLTASNNNNSALTAMRATLDKLSQSFLETSKSLISGVSSEGLDMVRNQTK